MGGFMGKLLGIRRPEAPTYVPPAVQAPEGTVSTKQQSAEGYGQGDTRKKRRMGKQSLFVSNNDTNTTGGTGLNA